jgi:hypothetical protein
MNQVTLVPALVENGAGVEEGRVEYIGVERRRAEGGRARRNVRI